MRRVKTHKAQTGKQERPMSKSLYGYARVSSADQNAEIQIAALKAAGCQPIRSEKVSGRSRDGRSELERLLDFVKDGDTLVVTKLDRLGRSTRDVLNLVHELEQKGASLRVLEPPVDTGGPMGKMVLTVLGMVAEMELGFIKERQRAGIEAAKAKGVYKGRPVTLDHAKVLELHRQGQGPTAIAKTMKCSRGAVYKVLNASAPKGIKNSGKSFNYKTPSLPAEDGPEALPASFE
jgi:DNA invertase Pin-like site-specific DNA recombinase